MKSHRQGDFRRHYYHLAAGDNIRRWIRVAACRIFRRAFYQHSLILAANILFLNRNFLPDSAIQ
jgi:hypothetical protein